MPMGLVGMFTSMGSMVSASEKPAHPVLRSYKSSAVLPLPLMMLLSENHK